MTASDKIEEAKNCFDKIKQSGRNNYQNYDYFELKDVLPIVRKICKKFKLKTKIDTDIERQCFILTITDKEDNSSEDFVVPYATITATDAGKWMQDFGRCQTYARRYLYLQAFEIAEPDEIDNKDQRARPKQQPKSKKITKTNQQKPKTKPTLTPAPKEEEPEPTKDDIKEALDTVYDIIVTQGNKEFTLERALFQLGRKYKNRPLLVKACEESLKTNSADKVKE